MFGLGQLLELKACTSTESLANTLRAMLKERELPSGYRLPSIRKLMELTRLRHNEVYRALSILAAEGWIEQKRGAGTFVLERSSATERPGGRGHSFKRIGVVPPPYHDEWAHYIAGIILDGICTQATHHQHRVEIIYSQREEQQDLGFADRLLSLNLDGVIWIQPPAQPPLALAKLVNAHMPMVLTGRGFASLPVPMIGMNMAALGDAVAEFMARHGRRHLICMVGCRTDPYTYGKIDAIRTALTRNDLALPDANILTIRPGQTNPFYSIDFEECTARFLERQTEFDTVFSMYPDCLRSFVTLHESGTRRCPNDFIFLQFGPAFKPMTPDWSHFPICFLVPPYRTLACQAVRELERLWGIDSPELPEDQSITLIEPPEVRARTAAGRIEPLRVSRLTKQRKAR